MRKRKGRELMQESEWGGQGHLGGGASGLAGAWLQCRMDSMAGPVGDWRKNFQNLVVDSKESKTSGWCPDFRADGQANDVPTAWSLGPGAGLGRGQLSLDMVNLRGLSAMIVEISPRYWLHMVELSRGI